MSSQLTPPPTEEFTNFTWSTASKLLPKLDPYDPVDTLLLTLVREEFGRDRTKQYQVLCRQKVQQLMVKASLIASTSAAMRACLKLESPPFFVKVLPCADPVPQQGSQIAEITTLYKLHLDALYSETLEELRPLLGPADSLPDSAACHRTSWEAWEPLTGKTRLASSLYGNPTIPKPPMFWSGALSAHWKRIRSAPTPRTTIKPVDQFVDSNRMYKMTSLAPNIFLIHNSTTNWFIPQFALDTLGLGLNFVPEAKEYPCAELRLDLNEYLRRIQWNFHWITQNPVSFSRPQGPILPVLLRRNTAPKMPPRVAALINFCSQLEQDFVSGLTANPLQPCKDITRNVRLTSKFFLRHANKLVIKPADKGGNIIIMEHKFYEYIMTNYLTLSVGSFVALPEDPTTATLIKVKDAIHALGIKPAVARLMLPSEVKCPQLYGLPKIHKSPISARPIVSGNLSPTEFTSVLIDFCLQPLVSHLPYYLKDGTQLLVDLKRIPLTGVTWDWLLFSLDVVNMYSNIPLDEAEESVYKECLGSREAGLLSPAVVRSLVNLVLTNNYFSFNELFYQQVQGIAMGTPCACVVSDIFICRLMQSLIEEAPRKPLYYRQYRDDGFGIWTHGQPALDSWLVDLNRKHKTIKFTITKGLELNYLDLKLTLDPVSGFRSETYQKPTDTQDYLHRASNHPTHCGDNIALAQTIRNVRNCSTFSSFEFHTHLLQHNLLRRGYSRDTIHSRIDRVRFSERPRFLNYRSSDQVLASAVPLVTPFARGMPSWASIHKKNRRRLALRLREALGSRTLFGSKILPSLGKSLIRAKYPRRLGVRGPRSGTPERRSPILLAGAYAPRGGAPGVMPEPTHAGPHRPAPAHTRTTWTHTDPHEPTRTHTNPHGPTRNHTDPHEPTRTHTGPHGPTRIHTGPHGPTRTHTGLGRPGPPRT